METKPIDKWLEAKIALQDEVKHIADWSEEKRLVAYYFLHTLGCSMTNIDYQIERLIRQKLKGS